jgi:hypothetical protein
VPSTTVLRQTRTWLARGCQLAISHLPLGVALCLHSPSCPWGSPSQGQSLGGDIVGICAVGCGKSGHHPATAMPCGQGWSSLWPEHPSHSTSLSGLNSLPRTHVCRALGEGQTGGWPQAHCAHNQESPLRLTWSALSCHLSLGWFFSWVEEELVRMVRDGLWDGGHGYQGDGLRGKPGCSPREENGSWLGPGHGDLKRWLFF